MTNVTTTRRPVAIAVAFLVALASLFLVAPTSPAVAAESELSSISGTVTDDTTGLPIQGATVAANLYSCSCNGASTTTDASGNFTVTGLIPQSYEIVYSAPGYTTEYYDDADFNGATAVVVPPTTGLVGYDAALAPVPAETGSISGTVTDDTTGLPISGVAVTSSIYACSCSPTTTTTDADGSYTLIPLANETYDVHFTMAGYADEYYDDTDYFGADQIVVNGAAVTGIDAALSPSSLTGISGTVTDEITGLPISGITVSAVSTTGPAGADAVTDVNGQYTIADLEAGDYVVYFNPCGCAYEPEFYDDAASPFDATIVTVVDGTGTTGIDAALAPLTTVSGIVTDTLGNPIKGVIVDVDEECGCTVGSAITDSDGYYEIVDIPAASYVVHFQSPDENVWTSEWYHDAYWPSAATVVDLTGAPSTIDETLVLARFDMTGSVLDTSGNPISKATVRVYTLDGRRVGVAKTNAAGDYTIRNLPAGEYRLRTNKPFFGVARWGFGPSPYNPDPAQFGPGSTQFDFVLQGAGALSTTVTKGGVPVRNVKVTAYRADAEVFVAAGKTDADGNLILHLPAGDYRLFYEATPRTRGTWSGGAPDWASATTVSLTSNATTVFDQSVLPKH